MHIKVVPLSGEFSINSGVRTELNSISGLVLCHHRRGHVPRGTSDSPSAKKDTDVLVSSSSHKVVLQISGAMSAKFFALSKAKL